jgi:SAM-dependent methyltransferase
MTSDEKAAAFGTTYAELYDRYLVPMLFAPYAEIVARRAANLHPQAILETAAGTGIATQSLAKSLSGASITATDLNEPMIEQAKAKADFRNVTWQQADAMKLPFADASFDLVVCQFGVMFFPEKQVAFREARRVLRPEGNLLFVVWEDWKLMPTAPLAIAADAVARLLGCDPGVLVSPPYYDEPAIRTDLNAAGFRHIEIDRVIQSARAASARQAAIATVHGSLIRSVIMSSAPERLVEATNVVERAIRGKLGDGRIVGTTRALVILAN